MKQRCLMSEKTMNSHNDWAVFEDIFTANDVDLRVEGNCSPTRYSAYDSVHDFGVHGKLAVIMVVQNVGYGGELLADARCGRR